MAQFEPSRILDNGVETDNVQQYVEIGANTYLGTKDGMKYALIPTSDNKFKLCELPCESSISLNTSKSLWYPTLPEENKNETTVSPSPGCRTIKKIFLLNSVSYALPQNSFFQIPQAQLTPISSKPTRFVKPRQRMQLLHGNPPYSACSPIPHATRGHRQRRPKQVWYQYRQPVLQSTPTSMSSPSSSLSPAETTRNSSITSSDESQISLEYPRVPNNTPNSEEESLGSKQKMLDLQQWIPQIHSSIENYVQMDPRESHNEKERKRRSAVIK
ncbi:hypothetical protein HNY73_008357 [Argiope bruennichi]|uniref:Uncharacterized protein n=1 Tax=Argiope bruennichi TaxID=94029 RepID=A0A8T0F738_ARGBR|nr:hypothetical protein HNY73_008357 [Argiope bruennichi]